MQKEPGGPGGREVKRERRGASCSLKTEEEKTKRGGGRCASGLGAGLKALPAQDHDCQEPQEARSVGGDGGVGGGGGPFWKCC